MLYQDYNIADFKHFKFLLIVWVLYTNISIVQWELCGRVQVNSLLYVAVYISAISEGTVTINL